MRLDTLGLETKKFYWHHYNFPPFSVGEAGFMRGPSGRDIGHGALAERALVPMIPSIEEFPYTIRVVSDILESNGSSSMASVCGSSLSLMDAGVPIKAPVAGIAMGLIKEGDDYIVLTDIAGVEDHLGDMDFKVAGTAEGITALQMDIKITGVTFDILRDALAQAKDARLDILGQMAQVIDAPRTELSAYAPRIITLQIDPSKIGMLIGKGGETIRGLSEEFESQIDVNDDGQVLVYSANGELGEKLAERITSMLKDVEVGDEFPNAKVVKTTTFGAFVELSKGTDGLLHISNVSPGQRVDTVEDVLNKGDEISVRVVEVDRERGRIGLRLARTRRSRQVGRGLAGSGHGGGRRARAAPRRDGGPRRRGGGRDGAARRRGSGRPRHGSGDRDPTAARPRCALTPPDGAGSASGSSRRPCLRAVRRARVLDRPARRRGRSEAGLSHLTSTCCSAGRPLRLAGDRPDLRRMGAELNAGTGKETTSVYSRVDRHLERRSTSWPDMVWRPRFDGTDLDPSARSSSRRSPCTRDDRRTRSSTSSARRPSAPSAGPRDHAAARRSSRHAADGSPLPRARATCRANVVSPRRARSTTDRSSSIAVGGRRAGRAPRRAGPATSRARAFVARTPSSTTVCLGGRASRATTALRAARARQRPRGTPPRASSRRSARSAGWPTRLLLPVALRGRRAGRPVPRHAARQRRRALRVVGRSSSASARTAPRRRARALQGERQGRVVLSLESTTSRMNRSAPPCSATAAAERRRARRAHRRRDDRRPARAGGELLAPERLSAAGIGPTRRVPRGAGARLAGAGRRVTPSGSPSPGPPGVWARRCARRSRAPRTSF
jgi:ribonuclease PH